jgi:hypothetical protein
VLPGPPVSAPRCAASLARTPAAPRPLPPGPEVARPHLSAVPFRITHAAVLPCSQPAPAVPMRHAPPAAIRAAQSRHVHAVLIHVAKPWTPPPFSPPRSAEPRTPTPPLPCLPRLCFKRHRPLCSHSLLFPLALLRPLPHERCTLPSFYRLSSTLMTEPLRSSSPSDCRRCRFAPPR